MSVNQVQAQPRPKAGGGRHFLLLGMLCGAVLTFAAPLALLVAVLMAPAIACGLILGTAGATRAVLLCSFAASLPALWRAWTAGLGWEPALAEITAPATLLLAWGAGAVAWAACELLPVLLGFLAERREGLRVAAARTELDRLRADWDLPDQAA